MKKEDRLTMKAIAICFKPYLKPEEAMIYCGVEHSALAARLEAFGICKNDSGYYSRADLDLMMSGTRERLPEFLSNRSGVMPIRGREGRRAD